MRSRLTRNWPRLLVGGLCVVLAAVVVASVVRATTSNGAPLTGTDLGRERAPDFRLRDSSGQAYSLSQFRGRVVVLAFLYTQCPDACPLTAELLRNVDAAAGHPQDVEYVAVSVDPVRDTPEAIAAFVQEHRLEELGNRFHYLIGALPELASVWQRYYIRDTDVPTPGQPVDHVSSLYFIDKHGMRRLLTHIDVPVEAIVRNLRAFEQQ